MSEWTGDAAGDGVGGRRVDELSGRPVGELVQQLTEQVSRLVRQELQLAKLELAEKGRRAGVGAGLFGAAGLVVLYGLATLIAAMVLLLATVLPAWVAALIVALALLVIAGVLALVGRGQLRRATPPFPADTAASVKADVDEITARARR